jgi:WD40 repeat protein
MLADDLRRWLAGRPIQARPVSKAEHAWRWATRNPALASVSVLLGIALIGGGAALWASNRQLRFSLAQTRVAEAGAQEKLYQSLLTEARLTHQSRRMGQRVTSLETLEQAARISPAIAVRSETAAALAKPDLMPGRRLPAFFPGLYSMIGYAPDLQSYFTPQPGGGFASLRVADGTELRRYRSPPGLTATAFFPTPDVRHALVAFSNGTMGVYAMNREEAIWVAPPFDGNSLHCGLHPSGDSVAFGHTDGAVRLRTLSTGEERAIVSSGPRVFGVNFDLSGERLLITRIGRLDFLEMESSRVLWSIPTSPTGMRPHWSADGKLVAHGGAAFNEIYVRHVGNGNVLAVLSGHRTYPSHVKFTPDGRRLVSQAFDNTVRLWDLASGTELLQAKLPLRGLGVSPDGRQIGAAIDSDTPALFTWAPETVFREWIGAWGFAGAKTGFHLSGDGRWLVTAESSQQRIDQRFDTLVDVSLWDAVRRAGVGGFRLTLPGRDLYGALTLFMAPDGQSILYSHPHLGICQRRVQTSADGSVSIRDEEMIPESRGSLLIGFGANDRDWLIFRPAEKRIEIWPVGRPQAARLVMPVTPEMRVAMSPDGRWAFTMVSAKIEAHLRSIDGASVKRVAVERDVRVQFSPDGQWLLTSNDDGHQTWRLPDLEPGPRLPATPNGDRVRMAAFSPDGAWLATQRAGATIDLWRTGGFAPLITLEPPLDLEATILTWTPDGQRLVLLARGPRVFEWDLQALRRELAARGLDW